jgi:hypothetical protein
MLTSQVRELEEEGFINREVFPVVPPKVEYSITKPGENAIILVDSIRNYGLELMDEFGIEKSKLAIQIREIVKLQNGFFARSDVNLFYLVLHNFKDSWLLNSFPQSPAILHALDAWLFWFYEDGDF